MRGAFDYLRGHPALGGRAIGSIGYCMGGGLSTMLACHEPALAAAVTYYGGPEEAQQIRCPVRGFYGAQDAPILAGLPAFTAGLESAGVDHEMQIYPDTGHAFFNDGRPSYRQEAARDAWARTLSFFAQTLDPVTPA
jgi:carboxymethylenebutenolidase